MTARCRWIYFDTHMDGIWTLRRSYSSVRQGVQKVLQIRQIWRYTIHIYAAKLILPMPPTVYSESGFGTKTAEFSPYTRSFRVFFIRASPRDDVRPPTASFGVVCGSRHPHTCTSTGAVVELLYTLHTPTTNMV